MGHRSAPARRGTRRRTTTRRRRPAARRSAPRARRIPRRGRTGIRQWWPGLLVVVAVLVGVAWDSGSGGGERVPAVTGRCTIAGSPYTVTAEQVANARTIAGVAHARGLPQRALVIALATAEQESGLRNLDYGDRDSLGLFQQRPSQGWGTPAQVRDPVHAAGTFFDHLVGVPHWETGDLTRVADAVQRSAFPLAYRRWTGFAEALASAVSFPDDHAFACS